MGSIKQNVDEMRLESQIRDMKEKVAELEKINVRDRDEIEKRCDEIAGIASRIVDLEIELRKVRQCAEFRM